MAGFREQLRDQQIGGAGGCGHPQAFMTDRQPQALALWMLTHQRQAIRAGSAKTGPGADAIESRQPRHVLGRALEHFRQHPAFDLRIGGAELPRGADEQLPGRTRLDIAGRRGALGVMGAGDVTQFHQGVGDPWRGSGR